MSELSADEIRRVRSYLAREERASQNAAESSKKSFFGWLKDVGFSWVLDKIVTYTWHAIRVAFGF